MILGVSWAALDAIAHFLYCPGMLGQRMVRYRWYHNIHLIPTWMFKWVCDRYETRLLATCPSNDEFFESDQTVSEVRAAFDQGEKHVTARPIGYGCQHMNITAGGRTTITEVHGWCGCTMQPVYPTSAS